MKEIIILWLVVPALSCLLVAAINLMLLTIEERRDHKKRRAAARLSQTELRRAILKLEGRDAEL